MRYSIKSFVKATDAGASVTFEIKTIDINRFHYARVSKLSNYKCRACGIPIRSTSVRRMVLCPVCGTADEMT
jgi:predicted RNA-binding Zn-ribbon protein involved in translation (DUF1610 family)